jgi:hypothetical protein
MKQSLMLLFLSIFMSAANAETPTKKVCQDEQANGKAVKVCKTIRVHKKLEGTTVPVKK